MTLTAWQSGAFADTFQREMSSIDPALLPLHELMRHGSAVIGRPEFMILGSSADGETLRIRTGVFFRSVLAGCSCADDPTPTDTFEEYGELEFQVDRGSARTTLQTL